MKARRCCWLQESSCGSDSVAESHRGGHACSRQPTRVHAGTPGLVGPEWCRGPCPGARLPQGGVWEGQGPDPVHLSANRLTSTPWAAFPVTSYDSITASELKAKLFQKGKNKGNLHSPAGQRSQLGTKGTRETSTRRQGSIHSWGLSSGFVAAAGGVSAEQQ